MAGNRAGNRDSSETLDGHAIARLERFADFQREIIHDNIVLCDAKSGIVIAFCSALVLYSLDSFAKVHYAEHGFTVQLAWDALFLVAAIGFLVACHFALLAIMPRFRNVRHDHLFWESAVFKLDAEDYLGRISVLGETTGHEERHRHIHTLAGICRAKFANFVVALRFAQAAFGILVAAELAHIFL